MKETDIKIILFLCNWGPHAAFQELQDTLRPIPAQIKMIRIPCTGRISKALLLKPFEMGADGVGLVGCEKGACHYGSGTKTAGNNVDEAREILHLLGLGRDRIQWATFKGEDSTGLLDFLTGFRDRIQAMGESPVTPPEKPAPVADRRARLREIVAAHDVYACQDCGKCSSACSLTLAGKPLSPRAIANNVIMGDLDNPRTRDSVWACLTCGLCYERCPQAVNFPEFVRDVRGLMLSEEKGLAEVHGGFFQSLFRTMASPGLPIRHWDWLPDNVRTDPGSKVLFFGGCAPYFDVFFRTQNANTRAILSDGLRLLNFFDVHPALLDNERCCGHDLLWRGDRENFLKLARQNADAIHEKGVQEVITACPECYRTLAHDYPALGVETRFTVTHLFDFLEKEISKGAVGFQKFPTAFTFQDPCRLSRLAGRPELPRNLLSKLDPARFVEMRDHGASAICCGNCAWTGCDAYSKALQVKRLRQARETGAETLVTACPKCQIHLRCAMEDPFFGKELNMDMMDLTSLIAKTILWK